MYIPLISLIQGLYCLITHSLPNKVRVDPTLNKIIGLSNGSIVTSMAKLNGTQDTTITGTQVIRPVVMGTKPRESSRWRTVQS